MFLNSIGVIGLGVMGKNLSLNIANNGYTVSVFNRTVKNLENMFDMKIYQNKIFPFSNIQSFIESLKKPRCILIMVKSGDPVDVVIKMCLPFLNMDDIIIDGGNSHYKDTISRSKFLMEKHKVNFLGVGISGGEEGALKGPSIMPGGSKKAYSIVSPIFEKISAKYKNIPCVNYIGENGSGHYVKMIHNGIEYSDMQLISEIYFLFKKLTHLSNLDISSIFSNWNKTELNSYLIEITSYILKKKDDLGNFILDNILDIANQKGTGKWTSKNSMDLSVPLSLITEAVYFRFLSSFKSQRVLASSLLFGPARRFLNSSKLSIFIEDARKALFFSKIIAYSQGFFQLKVASDKYNWNLKFYNIASIFRSGCIIRAKFLNDIVKAYEKNNNLVNLLIVPFFQNILNNYQSSLRNILKIGIENGIALPGLSSALSYYDAYRSDELPTNLIQAQRDFFGSHTYERKDKVGFFHTLWKL